MPSASRPRASIAYDYYLRGMAAFHRFSPAANAEALALFAQAVELDPDYAAAYAMAARCYLQRKGFGWVADRAAEIAETRRLARRAAELGRRRRGVRWPMPAWRWSSSPASSTRARPCSSRPWR